MWINSTKAPPEESGGLIGVVRERRTPPPRMGRSVIAPGAITSLSLSDLSEDRAVWDGERYVSQEDPQCQHLWTSYEVRYCSPGVLRRGHLHAEGLEQPPVG